MTPQTHIELDLAAAAGCQSPGCTHEDHSGTIYFHGACHPHAPVQVSYARGSSVLRVECAICDRLITEIAVR